MNEGGQISPTGGCAKLKKNPSPVFLHRDTPQMTWERLTLPVVRGHSSVFLASRHYKWGTP